MEKRNLFVNVDGVGGSFYAIFYITVMFFVFVKNNVASIFFSNRESIFETERHLANRMTFTVSFFRKSFEILKISMWNLGFTTLK